MAHQQKLVHIVDITSIAANGNQVIATGFQLAADNEPALAVARQETTHEIMAADPSEDSRVWSTAITTAGFTINWAGFNAAVCDLRVVSHVFHSICFDISTVQSPY